MVLILENCQSNISTELIIPVVEKFIIPIETSIKPAWITEILFMYPMAGYYLDKRMDIGRVTYKYLGIIWLIFILSASINILCEYKYLVNNPLSTVTEDVITGSLTVSRL